MGVVTALFLAGGNMEKLVCDPFHTKELFKASRLYFTHCLILLFSYDMDLSHLSCLPLMIQVVDTPYLVNPEWKNFIPGYMYNDSDLELTAESFYRQSKLIFMYLGDCILSDTFQKQSCCDYYSSHSLLHCFICILAFTFGNKTEGISQPDKVFIQL